MRIQLLEDLKWILMKVEASDQLQEQVEILSQVNHSLEVQVSQLKTKNSDLMNSNSQSEAENRELKRSLAKAGLRIEELLNERELK